MFTILITFDILIFGVYVNSGYVIRVFHPFDTVHISKISKICSPFFIIIACVRGFFSIGSCRSKNYKKRCSYKFESVFIAMKPMQCWFIYLLIYWVLDHRMSNKFEFQGPIRSNLKLITKKIRSTVIFGPSMT